MTKLTTASCQIAYWQGGKLRIANYLTRRTFSTTPTTLEVMRIFITPRTIRAALLELGAADGRRKCRQSGTAAD